MGAIWTGLSFFVGMAIPAVVSRVFLFMGIAWLGFTGIQALIDYAANEIYGQVGQIPDFALVAMKNLQIDVVVSIFLSAVSIKATITASKAVLGRRAGSAVAGS